MRRNQGLSESRPSLHLAFIGNPGTGKTTVARYIGKIYKAMGLLSKGQLIETNRAGLVGRYVGETAKITQEVIDSAIGGVLFIDEAYTLASDIKGDYGREAIDTILIAMENNRDNLVVIVAGYDNLMEKFFESNPGLKSRVNTKIHFDDYTTDELCEIFISMCEAKQFKVTDGAMAKLRKLFDNVNRAEFGNGRGVRNIFERVTKNQAKRIVANKTQQTADLSLIIEEDVDKI
jgi:AAA+ superfamily predicted ATPase